MRSQILISLLFLSLATQAFGYKQSALDTFLPGGTIDSITPNVQRALGNDVMNTLRERHADRPLDKRELQAYAFAAYTTLQNKNRLLPAPNPVIRAFKKLFDY